jgi:hypothetical protein
VRSRRRVRRRNDDCDAEKYIGFLNVIVFWLYCSLSVVFVFVFVVFVNFVCDLSY